MPRSGLAWHPDGDSLPGLPVEVFADAGRRAASMVEILTVFHATRPFPVSL